MLFPFFLRIFSQNEHNLSRNIEITSKNKFYILLYLQQQKYNPAKKNPSCKHPIKYQRKFQISALPFEIFSRPRRNLTRL